MKVTFDLFNIEDGGHLAGDQLAGVGETTFEQFGLVGGQVGFAQVRPRGFLRFV